MLRLDQLIIEDQQQSAEGQDPAAAAGLPHLKKALKAQKARLLPFSSQLKADDWLLAMELEESSGALAVGPPPALLLDLNDPKMTFEVLRGTEAEEYANAAATVLPAMPKVSHSRQRSRAHGSIKLAAHWQSCCIASLWGRVATLCRLPFTG